MHMRILAIVPARKGSKGVTQKNIHLLNGKPLIFWTLNECKEFDSTIDVVVSTDSQKIANISKDLGFPVDSLRPAEFSGDNVETLDVLQYETIKREKKVGFKYDYVLLLQPTSPLRKVHHIRECITLLDDEIDSVVSIKNVQGDHPFRMKRVCGSKLVNFIDQGFEDMRPRQKLPPVYIRNGAIYLTKSELIRSKISLVGENCSFYEMSQNDSINIDNLFDFYATESVMREYQL